MSDLLAARSQMAMSLAFHIIFAVVGIGMPVLMVIAERRWLKTGDRIYLDLAKRWAKGTAILFAVGAVSGTVLSFELGLLWPGFMEFAGPIIGMPFSLEGFAFFTEAIFLGIYLYGWDRISPRAHIWAGILVAVSGAASGIFVVIANAWMNTPTGFDLVDGRVTNVDPIAGDAEPGGLPADAAHDAGRLRRHRVRGGRHPRLPPAARPGERLSPPGARHRAAGRRARGGAAADLGRPQRAQSWPNTSRRSSRRWKRTSRRAGGRRSSSAAGPTSRRQEVRYAIEIPCGLSFLAFNDPNAEVKGLNEFPRDDGPTCRSSTSRFRSWWRWARTWRWYRSGPAWVGLAAPRRDRRPLAAPWRIALAAPMGFIAIEAGWMVTEVGRQPWIIYGVLRTADAVTPMPGLSCPFLAVHRCSTVSSASSWSWLLYRQIIRSPRPDEWSRIYDPAPGRPCLS